MYRWLQWFVRRVVGTGCVYGGALVVSFRWLHRLCVAGGCTGLCVRVSALVGVYRCLHCCV